MVRILGHLAAGLLLAGVVVGCAPATSSKPATATPPGGRDMQGMQEKMREQKEKMREEMEKHKGGPPKDDGKEKPKEDGKEKDKGKP